MVSAYRGATFGVIAVSLGASALVASCSAGVDGYHLEGLSGTGGGTQSGGAGGDASVTGGTSGSGGATGGNGNTTGGAGTSGGTGATGGVPTGGTAGTGGTGGTAGTDGGANWPADPKLVTISMPLSGITTGVWDTTGTFLLLEPASHRFWDLEPTTGQVSGPHTFQAPMTTGVQPWVFGLNSSNVFVVVDTTLYLLDRAGNTTNSFPLSGSPGLGTLHGTHASSTFFMGSLAGTYILADGATAFTSTTLTNVGAVATDGNSFAFRMVNATSSNVHLIATSATSGLTSPCQAGQTTDNTDPVSVFGNTVSWVANGGAKLEWHVATVTSGTTCGEIPGSPVVFGVGGTAGPFPIGLLSDQYALVAPLVIGSAVSVQILNFATGGGGATISVNAGASGGAAFVVASGPKPHYAVLVGDVPGLITF